ncbi:MAG: hypothetical protein AB7F66_15885 [Bacteriovoracia bacterium]
MFFASSGHAVEVLKRCDPVTCAPKIAVFLCAPDANECWRACKMMEMRLIRASENDSRCDRTPPSPRVPHGEFGCLCSQVKE